MDSAFNSLFVTETLLQLNSAEPIKNDKTNKKVYFIIKVSKSKGNYYYISNEYFFLTFLTFYIFFCKTTLFILQNADYQNSKILPKSYIPFTNFAADNLLILLQQKN